MSIGILIITHAGIGAALLEAATKMLEICPLLTETLSVTNDSNVDMLRAQAKDMRTALDRGDGVLVLTDMYGSTPGNIANDLQDDDMVRVVSGINLPMLIRVLNYPRLNLQELAEKALSGGRSGILLAERQT